MTAYPSSPSRHRRLFAVTMIALGIYLNVPFSILGATFSYPGILRQPTAEILVRFHQGGASLILTWYAFVLAALGLVPLAVLAYRQAKPAQQTVALLAAVAGVAAGLFQTVGLIRWVFVVPSLAQTFTDVNSTPATRDAVVVAFQALHQFAGVGIGEHLGQLATASWAALLSLALARDRAISRLCAGLGLLSAGMIFIGLIEGFTTVMTFAIGPLGALTPVGYVALTVWMIWVGIAVWNKPVVD